MTNNREMNTGPERRKRQLTIHEKWARDSKLPGGGISFSDKPDSEATAKVKLEGFTEEELKKIFGRVQIDRD